MATPSHARKEVTGPVTDSPDEASAALDSAIDAEMSALLSGLDFLDPASTSVDPTGDMPAEVWTRLRAALAAEAATRTDRGKVTVLSSRRRATRWAGGLVAASVALVAVGFGVTALRSPAGPVVADGGSPSIVALADEAPTAPQQEAATSAQASPESAAAHGGATPESFSGTSDPTTAGAAGDRDDSEPEATDPKEGRQPAARMVMASATNYTPEDLRGQVASLFLSLGVDSAAEAAAMEVTPAALPVGGGFTEDWDALRDCVTFLTRSPDVQALVVDRAKYLGSDAGVVVAPDLTAQADTADTAGASPAPTFSLPVPMGSLDVWVVDPQCQDSASIRDFLDYEWD